jgi:hypothetical protein
MRSARRPFLNSVFVRFGIGQSRRGLWSYFLAGKLGERFPKPYAKGMAHKPDNVAALATAPAIPKLFSYIDAETIFAAALRARSNPLCAAFFERKKPPCRFKNIGAPCNFDLLG